MGALTIRSLPTSGSKKLARLLKNAAPGLTCRVCGQRDFALVESPDEGIRTTLPRVKLAEPENPFRIQQALVTVICTHCGHLEQFAEAVLNGIGPAQYGEDHTGD